MDWSKDSQKYNIYTKEEGMHELVFGRQQPKVKDFRRHCWNVLFPHVRQQLSDKSQAMETEDLTGCVQALEFTNEEERQTHKEAIEEKDATITLLHGDLKIFEHNNVTLQAQRGLYKKQLQKCRDIIGRLKKRYVPLAKDPGKDNIVMIIEKYTIPEEDEFYEYPYYISTIRRWCIDTRIRWFKAQYPNHRFIMEELDNEIGIPALNRFEEEGFVEHFQCHFRFADNTSDAFYALATPVTLE